MSVRVWEQRKAVEFLCERSKRLTPLTCKEKKRPFHLLVYKDPNPETEYVCGVTPHQFLLRKKQQPS